jgi:hypothetical protein
MALPPQQYMKEIGNMQKARRYIACINRRAGVYDSYMHCAALLKRNAPLVEGGGYGMNMCGDGPRGGIHAEMHALSKLEHKKTSGRRRMVCDLLVIRITVGGNKLGASRPCRDCIVSMYHHAHLKIGTVMYSTQQGTICAEKLLKMMQSIDTAHVTRDKSRY